MKDATRGNASKDSFRVILSNKYTAHLLHTGNTFYLRRSFTHILKLNVELFNTLLRKENGLLRTFQNCKDILRLLNFTAHLLNTSLPRQ